MGFRWPAALVLASTLLLAGCGVGVDAYVREYEGGDVEVKFCQKVGETITDAGVYPASAEDGDQEDEIWKCTITERAGTVDRCYVVHESKVKTIVRGVKCWPIS